MYANMCDLVVPRRYIVVETYNEYSEVKYAYDMYTVRE